MTLEQMGEAIENRNKRSEALYLYNHINRIFNQHKVGDLELVHEMKHFKLTEKEAGELLMRIRERLDAEISALDRRFEEL